MPLGARRTVLTSRTVALPAAIATQLVAASGQYWTVADNASLSMGTGVRMSLVGWGKFDSLGTNRTLSSKGNISGAATHEYGIFYNTATSRFNFRVSTGAVLTTVANNLLGAPVINTWYQVAGIYDGTNILISTNGGVQDTAAYSADIVDGTAAFRLGADSGATLLMNGALDNWLVYRRALTVNELTQLYANGRGLNPNELSGSLLTGLAAAYGLDNTGTDSSGSSNDLAGVGTPTFVPTTRPGTGGRIFFDGNSLTASLTYPGLTLGLLNASWTRKTVAVDGQTTSDMITRAPTQIDVFRVSGARQVIAAWEGTNDLKLGADAATAYAHLVTYCSDRKALGFRVIILTLLPRNDGGVGFEANRQTVNTSIRNNWPTFADALADVATDPNIGPDGSQNNLTYYSDGTHLTPTGDAIIAGFVAPKILAFS